MGTYSQEIDDYIKAFEPEKQEMMNQIRALVHQVVPTIEETISWRMPTFKYKGNLVHFAAFKKHIGFYPLPEAVRVFEEELAQFSTSKGAIQFPVGTQLPLALIEKMVRFRVVENDEAEKLKLEKKKKGKAE